MVFFSLKHALLAFTTVFLVKLTLAHPLPSVVYSESRQLDARQDDAPAILNRGTSSELGHVSFREFLDDFQVYTRAHNTHPRPASRIEVSAEARKQIRKMAGIKPLRMKANKVIYRKADKRKYRKLEKWHKKQLYREMKHNPHLQSHGAVKGEIAFAAHSGGSNPKEKVHITAAFRMGDGQPISHVITDEDGNPKSTDLYHVYTSNPNNPEGHPPGVKAPHIGPKTQPAQPGGKTRR
ncbi:hypothetical protein NMY22_g12479 [Coprinellus aureogranulatus]|nr:hypothetical protein NMY22_g12479 [Coprinellus aureogranulatus]